MISRAALEAAPLVASLIDDVTPIAPAPEEVVAGVATEGVPTGPPKAPDPTAALVAQLGPTVATAVGALALLQPVNEQLPPLPVPPFVPLPSLPPSAAPVQTALVPAVGPACGYVGTAYVLLTVLQAPIPVTPQHFAVVFGEIFAGCSVLSPT